MAANKIADNIRLDTSSFVPIYQQIADQFQELIVARRMMPGDHLPTVRHLGTLLNISPNTAARAYLELERKQIVVAKRGGGTVVASITENPTLMQARQQRLLNIVNEHIIKNMSMGFKLEELEAAFYSRLEWWREVQHLAAETQEIPSPDFNDEKIIRIYGSHDVALNILISMMRQNDNSIRIDLNNVGSLGGLIALEEGKADLAGIHLLDEETGEYNLPFIKRVLPGWEVAVIHLAYRVQGLMVPAGNPKKIQGLADLCRPDITFLNRQKGSGTRVLLDMQIKHLGMNPKDINGYSVETDNHLSVGIAVAEGRADTGLGIEAAARNCGLDFLPLFRERYDLVTSKQKYLNEILARLIHIIKSDEFKRVVFEVGGYDTQQTGALAFIP